MPTFTRTIIGVAALGLAACGAEPAVEPTEYDDVAQMLASSVTSDAGGGLHGAIDDALMLAFGEVPVGFGFDRFGWASGRHGDGTYKYRLTCADVTGRTLPACDATTDSATVIAAWYGVTHAVAYDHRFNRAAIWQFEHLQTSMGTITGVNGLSAQATFGVIGKPANYTLTTTFDERYLLDGREVRGADLTGDLAVTRNDERFDIDALITLDIGAITAAIELDGDQVVRVNLDTSFPGE